jgi:hypothetical protein
MSRLRIFREVVGELGRGRGPTQSRLKRGNSESRTVARVRSGSPPPGILTAPNISAKSGRGPAPLRKPSGIQALMAIPNALAARQPAWSAPVWPRSRPDRARLNPRRGAGPTARRGRGGEHGPTAGCRSGGSSGRAGPPRRWPPSGTADGPCDCPFPCVVTCTVVARARGVKRQTPGEDPLNLGEGPGAGQGGLWTSGGPGYPGADV